MLTALQPWHQRVSSHVVLSGLEDPSSTKPILHFMHGNGFCGAVYETFLRRFSSDYALFLCDAQGHGDSEAGLDFPGWNVMASQCASVARSRFKDRGSRPLIGVGHSLGGVLSLLIAAQEPPLFDRLILLDPVLFSPLMLLGIGAARALGFSHVNPMARRTRARASRWASREEARASFRDRGIFKGWPEVALDSYVEHALQDLPAPEVGVSLKCPTWFEAEIFDSTPRGLWKSIARIPCPTLILVGDETYSFLGRSAKRASRRNPLIRTATLPGGHCFMLEHPEATENRVREFLADSSP